MKQSVYVIPIEEIKRHFDENSRQDVKIIVPEILTEELFNLLKKKGKDVKAERLLDTGVWLHSAADEANSVIESGDLFDNHLPQDAQGPFAIAFANEKVGQDEHYHRQHLEIYFSEHAIAAEYRCLEDAQRASIELPHGGAIIFAPKVIHKMQLRGLTLVIEVPAIINDKVNEKL